MDGGIIELIAVLVAIFLFLGIPTTAVLYLLLDSVFTEDERKEEHT